MAASLPPEAIALAGRMFDVGFDIASITFKSVLADPNFTGC